MPQRTPIDTFTPRPTTARLAPLGPEDRNEAQRALLVSRPDYNIYKTLTHHLDFVRAFGPLAAFTLQGSSLPPREREIIVLRMGWLGQSEYEWSQHSRIAKSGTGLSDADVQRIAQGPDTAGWSDFDAALLRMVDELRYEALVSDATWLALRTRYSDQQMLDALVTAGLYLFVSMILNSLGVQLDPGLQDRLPRDLPLPALATRPLAQRLAKPRIKALTGAEMKRPELAASLARSDAVPKLYATLANHPKLYGPYVTFDSFVQSNVHLPSRMHELLILRTLWNTRTEYAWAHQVQAAKVAGLTDADVARTAAGPSANGWSEEQAALLRAADELHCETFISDATWQTLRKYYDIKQMIDIVCTVGGYGMSGLALNSLGIQLEPGYPPMPEN